MEKPKSWVYFIQEGPDGPIKIGYTASNPKARLAALQTGNAKPLRLLAWSPGTAEDERRLHERFEEIRMVGEWFQPTSDLIGFIQGVAWTVRGDTSPEKWSAVVDLSEEQIVFICGIADGRIALRSSERAAAVVGKSAKAASVPRRLDDVTAGECAYAVAALDEAAFGSGPLGMGLWHAVVDNDLWARGAVMKAALAAHEQAAPQDLLGGLSRQQLTLVAEFLDIRRAAEAATALAREFHGREALDSVELLRVAESRRALRVLLDAPGPALRTFGEDAVRRADDVLAEVESVHGHAVAYLRVLEDAADGVHPHAPDETLWSLDTTDLGPLSDESSVGLQGCN